MQRQPTPRIAERIDSSPIVMAAVDLSNGVDAARRACPRPCPPRAGRRPRRAAHLRHRAEDRDPLAGTGLDDKGNNIYVQRLVELKDWARPLGVEDDRISVHVLEAVDPASALIEYARHNQVDHIVIGARASSALRRYLGSVSAQVVAEAPCTVTVVRAG